METRCLLAPALEHGVKLTVDPNTNQFSDFKFIRDVKSGNFGQVAIYQYIGENPNVLRLCDMKQQVVIKTYTNVEDNFNDINNSALIYLKSLNTSPEAKFVLALPLLSNANQVLGLVSQYISMDEKCSQSADIENYVQEIFANSHINSGLGISVIINQLISSMFYSMKQFHEHGFYHRDLSARNWVVGKPIYDKEECVLSYPSYLIDYGYSTKYDANGCAPYLFPTAPIPWTDCHTLLRRESTNRADTFSFKASMVEIMSYALGELNCDKVLRFTPGESLEQTANHIIRVKNDINIIYQYLNNLKMLANKFTDSYHKNEILRLCDIYSNIFFYTPEKQNVVEENIKIEKLLLESNKKFALQYFSYRKELLKNEKKENMADDELLTFINNIKELLWTTRVIFDPVHAHLSAEFKQSDEFKTIVNACSDLGSFAKEIFGNDYQIPDQKKIRGHKRGRQLSMMQRDSVQQALEAAAKPKSMRSSKQLQRQSLPMDAIKSVQHAPLPLVPTIAVKEVTVEKKSKGKGKEKDKEEKDKAKKEEKKRERGKSVFERVSSKIFGGKNTTMRNTIDSADIKNMRSVMVELSTTLAVNASSSGNISPRSSGGSSSSTSPRMFAPQQSQSTNESAYNSLPASVPVPTAYAGLPDPQNESDAVGLKPSK